MRGKLVLAALVATVSTMGMTVASAHAAPSTKKFCNLNWKLTEVFNTIDDPTPAQTEKIEAKIYAILDDAEPVAPEEIKPQVTAAAASLRQGLEVAFEDPTVQENAQQIDAWVSDNCGYQVVDVHATEYHFDGIPKTLEPGRTIFRLINDGAEVHELGLARIKTSTPIKKLLADEKRADKETAFVGGTFATQGDTGYAYTVLKKGRHGAVCFVPVGSVDPETEVEGPPHALEGMVQEFKVS